MLLKTLEVFYKEGEDTANNGLPIPAYDYVLKISHIFNLLDARKAISVSERPSYIKKIRDLAKLCADKYVEIHDSQLTIHNSQGKKK